MGHFTEQNDYPVTVEKYEGGQQTQVLGGEETAPSNLPLKRLVNRTNWLKLAYDALKTSYDAFVISVANSFTSANNAISAEATTRANADTAEATARANAVSAEATARAAADTALQTDINTRAYSNSVYTKTQLGNLTRKVLEIGFWDMDAVADKIIDLDDIVGLDVSKIRAVSATIRPDATGADSERFGYDIMESGDCGWGYSTPENGNVIKLSRALGGYFDKDLFNSTDINRGWVILEVEE